MQVPLSCINKFLTRFKIKIYFSQAGVVNSSPHINGPQSHLPGAKTAREVQRLIA